MRVEDLPVASLGKLFGFDTERQSFLDQARGAAARANEIRNSLRYSKLEPTAAQNAELAALDSARAKATWMHDHLHSLCSNLRAWLTGLPRGTTLETVETPANPVRRGETLEAAIERIRDQITTVGNQLDMTRHAPLPRADQKDLIRDWVRLTAARCRPMISFQNDQCRVDLLRPDADAHTAFLDGLSVLARAVPDALAAMLIKDLDDAGMPGANDGALSAPDRIAKVAQLERELLTLERDEEHLIERAHASGVLVQRRETASAAAVLNVRIAARKAAAAVAA
jgi:hypothetical protein